MGFLTHLFLSWVKVAKSNIPNCRVQILEYYNPPLPNVSYPQQTARIELEYYNPPLPNELLCQGKIYIKMHGKEVPMCCMQQLLLETRIFIQEDSTL